MRAGPREEVRVPVQVLQPRWFRTAQSELLSAHSLHPHVAAFLMSPAAVFDWRCLSRESCGSVWQNLITPSKFITAPPFREKTLEKRSIRPSPGPLSASLL